MHPVNAKTNFGIKGIQVRYYNGISVVNGYIIKQVGTNRFNVTDGSHPKTCFLAQNATEVAAIGASRPSICTIPISGGLGTTPHGATFTPVYALDSSTITVANGGFGWSGGDGLIITGGTRASTVITFKTQPSNGDTVTLNGSVVTFSSGATNPSILNVQTAGGLATIVSNFYFVLTNTGDANIRQANYQYTAGGAIVNVYSNQTPRVTGNTFTLAASSSNVTFSTGATLLGGINDPAVSSAPTLTAITTGGVITGINVTGAGQFAHLLSNPAWVYYIGGDGRIPAQFNLRYNLSNVPVSGGVGYAANDQLVFNGISYTSEPIAYIPSVTNGAPDMVLISDIGAGISVAASSVSVVGGIEHVRSFTSMLARTIEGHNYHWTLKSQVGNSAVIGVFNE